jgi:asparagine synthase (glutamine-hydrolysing)
MARLICREFGVPLEEVIVDRPTPIRLIEAATCIEIASKAQIEIAALCIPLARRISADGFKACLSGEAADELFGGYGNMCIKATSLDDVGWRRLRIDQVAKMGRGNFVRCNKAFFAAGVECRLPFMEQALVESVLAMSKIECPPGKGLLKSIARGILPASLIRRRKETFQGASGLSVQAARQVANPTRFYGAEIRRCYGIRAME